MFSHVWLEHLDELCESIIEHQSSITTFESVCVFFFANLELAYLPLRVPKIWTEKFMGHVALAEDK